MNIKPNFLPMFPMMANQHMHEENNNQTLTAQEINKQIVIEVLQKKAIENATNSSQRLSETNDYNQMKHLFPTLAKCEFHLTKLNSKCRKCQDIRFDFQAMLAKSQQGLIGQEPNTVDKVEETSNANKIDLIRKENDRQSQAQFTPGSVIITPFGFPLVIPNFISASKYEFIPNTDQTSQNLNPLIYSNITSCQYFKELLSNKHIFGEVCLEISENANSLEPWTHGQIGVPSTVFCCLYRLMLMKLNTLQLKFLLNCGELTQEMMTPMTYFLLGLGTIRPQSSIFLKATGYLYLRYLANPIDLLSWFEKDLGNVNKYQLFGKNHKYKENMFDNSNEVEFGEYLDKLLRDNEYFNTRLPKLPYLVEKEIVNRLNDFKQYRERKKENLNNLDLITKGQTVSIRLSNNDKENWIQGKILNINDEGKEIHLLVILNDDQEKVVELGNAKFQAFSSVHRDEKSKIKNKSSSRSRSKDRQYRYRNERRDHTRQTRENDSRNQHERSRYDRKERSPERRRSRSNRSDRSRKRNKREFRNESSSTERRRYRKR